ncbi:MAG: twin-arginine translocase TatA/TatE family subunit [Candidatus Kapaibacterium sp.]
MFENLGGGEVLLIFLVILIFFGPKKIPELATSLGKGLRKFKDAKDGLEDQLKTVLKEPVEALQAAKSQFDQHLSEAQKPIQETAQAFQNMSIPTPAPVPTPAAESPATVMPTATPVAPPPANTLP